MIEVGFDSVQYTYKEGETVANLIIHKFNASSALTENITVFFSTLNNTANGKTQTFIHISQCPNNNIIMFQFSYFNHTAGLDYIGTSRKLVILASDVDHIAVHVEIVDDTDPENLESFYGKLDISCESATFAQVRVSLATVMILDNDGKC